MKKSNYLHYLNEYQTKLPIDVQKTFKGLKKHPKQSSKSTKSKTNEQKTSSSRTDVTCLKKQQNKQNLHPNIQLQPRVELGMKIKPELLLTNTQLSHISHNNTQIAQSTKNTNPPNLSNPSSQFFYQPKSFQLTLTRCNFQPSHPCDDLFLIETQQGKTQLIVCEKCSQRFTKKTRISSFQSIGTRRHSYAQLVHTLQEYEQYDKRLKRLQTIERENISYTLKRLDDYYGYMVQVISEARHDLQASLLQVYTQNQSILKETIKEGRKIIDLLNKTINRVERQCQDEESAEKLGQSSDSIQEEEDEINRILGNPINKHISLNCINVEIPLSILESFKNEFMKSKFCIRLIKESDCEIDCDSSDGQVSRGERISEEKNEEKNQEENENSQEISQNHQNSMKPTLSPDYRQEIPFNIQYSQNPSQQKQQIINFSHKMESQEVLSKVSSSEQLLIQSLRNDHFYEPIEQQVKHVQENDRKESSPYSISQKRNFIKELHNIEENEEISDMLCDEDFSLSVSHPIYEDNRSKFSPFTQNPLKYLRLSNPPAQLKPFIAPLTISQLTSHSFTTSQQQDLQIDNKKLEISFQLDENVVIMVDQNILPSEDVVDGEENWDIISPAFKAI